MSNSTKTSYPWEPAEIFEDSYSYDIYPGYDEERMSYVDDDKNVIVHESCVNISQENYSQYIPFEMDRYYQGIDLMDMDIQIYFVNSQMGAGSFRAVNVSFSENRIRFGWLVDSRATGVAGDLLFEIRAIGQVQDSNGTKKQYVWKSKQNSQITVLKSLHGELSNEPTQDWYADAVSYFSDVRDETLGYKNDAALSKAAALTSETNAAKSEKNALTSEGKAKTSESKAAISEANAKTSENNAANSAALAKDYSDTTRGLLDTYKTEINNNINSFKTDVNNEVKDFTTTFTNKTTELGGQIESIESALDAEISRADGAEKTIATNLASEVSRAQGVESGLDQRILDEVGRATLAEESLSRDLTNEVSRATNAEVALGSRVTTNENKIATLIGSDSGKSVRTIANEEIASQLIAPGASTSIDTLQEIATWISGHPNDAAAMNNQITANTNAINTNATNIRANDEDIAEIQRDITDLDAKVNTKANASDVTTSLAAKADVSALNNAVATINSNKADASTVSTLSASVGTLNASVNAISTAFNNKTDKSYVDSELAKKANVTDVNSALAGKSDTGHIHKYIHVGTEAPTDASVVLWVDVVNGLKYYNGSEWVNVPNSAN